MLHIRRAVKSDMKTILRLIEEAALWLRTKDTDQWSKPWPSKRKRNARIKRGIHAGRTWIVEDDGIAVATISCLPDVNTDLWTRQEQTERAVYVSRLIISRDYEGQGIGSELLDWAGRLAARQFGARWIRVDVWTTNTALHSYYEKRGFCAVGLCDAADYPSAALFQKSTEDIGEGDTPRMQEEPILLGPVHQRHLFTKPESILWRRMHSRHAADEVSVRKVLKGFCACVLLLVSRK